jgi:chaperonin GroEL
VAQALRSPIYTIAQNAGFEGNIVADRVLEKNRASEEVIFFDAQRGTIGPSARIIDPTLVATSVVRAAVSVATVLLTCEASITNIDREAPAPR